LGVDIYGNLYAYATFITGKVYILKMYSIFSWKKTLIQTNFILFQIQFSKLFHMKFTKTSINIGNQKLTYFF